MKSVSNSEIGSSFPSQFSQPRGSKSPENVAICARYGGPMSLSPSCWTPILPKWKDLPARSAFGLRRSSAAFVEGSVERETGRLVPQSPRAQSDGAPRSAGVPPATGGRSPPGAPVGDSDPTNDSGGPQS